jgi:hypothetical protein
MRMLRFLIEHSRKGTTANKCTEHKVVVKNSHEMVQSIRELRKLLRKHLKNSAIKIGF